MTQKTTPIQGGCGCKAVRYQLVTAPIIVHCCHCRWCQRETGASFALNAMIESDRVIVSGIAPWPKESLLRWRALLAAIEKYRAASKS